MRTADARDPQRGQATVELALCLPLIALLMAVLVEIGLLAADHVRVWHAAREAARIAVVDPDVGAAEEAAERSGLEGIAVQVEPRPEARIQGEPLTVEIVYERVPTIPLVGYLVGDHVLKARAMMRIEQP